MVDIECSRQRGDVLCYFRFADHEWDVVGFAAPEPCELEACEEGFKLADVRRTIH